MQVDIGEKSVISIVCSLKILGFPENSKNSMMQDLKFCVIGGLAK